MVISNTNQTITGCTGCYQLISPVTCSSKYNRNVGGYSSTVIINGLNEFTKHHVAAFAGDGSLPKELQNSTYEDVKCLYIRSYYEVTRARGGGGGILPVQ